MAVKKKVTTKTKSAPKAKEGESQLTNRQELFVDYYLESWNATDAARRAGYELPNKQGPRLLVNVGIKQLIEKRKSEIRAEGLRNKQNRINGLNEIHDKLLTVIAERAQAPENQNVAGGKTGLLVRQVKLVKVYDSSEDSPQDAEGGESLISAKQSVEVEEFAVDTGLLKELRETKKQVAIEVGEWSEKQEVNHTGGMALLNYEDLRDKPLEERQRLLNETLGKSSAPKK